MPELYPRNHSENLDPELFRNPTAEYRCTPFWAWNCDLKDETLLREIDCMKQMGMGGFHMHTRVGMSTRYLSDEFMAHISACVEKAKKEKMLAWLYDEDRWPSGFAGGFVTEDPTNWQRYLLFTPEGEAARNAAPERKTCPGPAELLGRYSVVLDENQRLLSYRRLSEGEQASDGSIWYAFLEYSKPTPRFHFRGYADTMSKKAIADFIHITHDRYQETVGDEFGKTIPAIFTDEPQMMRKRMLHYADEKRDVILSYTPDFEKTYQEKYGESFLDHLPEVVWELPAGVSPVRYHYHDHSTELFVQAFCDQIGAWCDRNGLYMTGHMMEEPTLLSQTSAVGECMRAYRSFTLPGIDMLCDRKEYTTAKQTASAAHQYGCPGVMSELYGVTNWDFDFRGHKTQGDWQAALGVSVRVPHLYWVSMHGEAKRDYPASIGHQSSWYPEYAYIEDHFARVNAAMTRGKAQVRIGVIHPIESYWLHFGPENQTGALRKEMDRRFAELTDWLLHDTLDFDFICESTLPTLWKENRDGFTVGEMRYDTVVVPSCETLRSTTLRALDAFAAKGGKVIFMGDLPQFVDALPSDAPEKLTRQCVRISWNRYALLQELEDFRDVRVMTPEGNMSGNLIYGMRGDGEKRFLFIAHTQTPERLKIPDAEHYNVMIRGQWTVNLLDTLSGEIRRIPATYADGWTVYAWECYDQSSLLLQLEPGKNEAAEATEAPLPTSECYLPEPASFTLHGKNVCLLDTAQWKIDNEPWREPEEMLRIGLKAKEILGMSTAMIQSAQPWILPEMKPEHTLSLKVRIFSDILLENALLGIEDLEDCGILLNGKPINKKACGWFVDEAIQQIPAGPILPGENILEVTKPFIVTTNVENMFLLGDFGVRVEGCSITIQEAPQRLHFGDWSSQGLPFYSDPMTCRFEIDGGHRTRLQLGRFSAPCVTVTLDGKKIGNVSLSPYTVDLGFVPAGKHLLEITVWPSRINTFGTLHLTDDRENWINGERWRTTGSKWSYCYNLRKVGLLTEPRLIFFD